MRDVNGKEVRVGQRVRWVYSEPREGVVECLDSQSMRLRTDDGFLSSTLHFEPYDKDLQRITVEVLQEPRTPEPQRQGANVRDGDGDVWVLMRDHCFPHPWQRVRDGLRREWCAIADPVPLSEGWTGDGDA